MKSLIITTLLLITTNIFAQNGQIAGTVISSDGKPAQYVSIKLKEISKGTISNEKGEFKIENIEPNKYTLVASFVGFKTLEKSYLLKIDGKNLKTYDKTPDNMWLSVMALEEEFGHDIPDEQAEKLQTVGDVIKYIEEIPAK